MAKQSAVVKQPTQLEFLESQYEALQVKMIEAKLQHEENLKKARELRELLSRTEKQVMVSEYEMLANEESALLTKINTLKAEENRLHRSKMSAVGTK